MFSRRPCRLVASRGTRISFSGRGRRGADGWVSDVVDVNEKRIEAASGSAAILNSEFVNTI